MGVGFASEASSLSREGATAPWSRLSRLKADYAGHLLSLSLSSAFSRRKWQALKRQACLRAGCFRAERISKLPFRSGRRGFRLAHKRRNGLVTRAAKPFFFLWPAGNGCVAVTPRANNCWRCPVSFSPTFRWAGERDYVHRNIRWQSGASRIGT